MRYIERMPKHYTLQLFRFTPHPPPGSAEVRPIAESEAFSDLGHVKTLAEGWFKLKWLPKSDDEIPLGVRVLDEAGVEVHRYEWWDFHKEQQDEALARRAKQRAAKAGDGDA